MKIIFLDRDGVINRFPGMGAYLTRWEDFYFLPGVIDAIALLSQAGFELNIISNQGCVAHGDISLEGLNDITHRMLKKIEAGGGKIAGVFYCVHQTSDNCDCKKPKTKLFHDALRGRTVDLKSVYFVGDSIEDIQAGENLGCQKILVLSGRNGESDLKDFPVKPDVVKKDLWEAAQWILQKKF